MERRYWTKQELIEYFKELSYYFEVDALRNDDLFSKGKADAYRIAAFELEHNFK